MNAPKPPHLAEEVEAAKNATSVGRLATLPVPAPNQRVPEVLTTVGVAVMVVVVEATTLSGAEVEARRPGKVDDHRFRDFGFSLLGS